MTMQAIDDRIAALRARLTAIELTLDGKATDGLDSVSTGDQAGTQSLRFMSITDLNQLRTQTIFELNQLEAQKTDQDYDCLLYTSPSPRD